MKRDSSTPGWSAIGKLRSPDPASTLRNLAGRQEDVWHAQARQAHRAGFKRKLDRAALNAPTEPVQKLLLLPLISTGAHPMPRPRMIALCVFSSPEKPVGPLRHSWNSMNM